MIINRIEEVEERLQQAERLHDWFLLHAKRDVEWLLAEHARLSAWVEARVRADLNDPGLVLNPLSRMYAPVVAMPEHFTPTERAIAAGLDALRPPDPREPFTLGDLTLDRSVP